jgi:hypothetical protein
MADIFVVVNKEVNVNASHFTNKAKFQDKKAATAQMIADGFVPNNDQKWADNAYDECVKAVTPPSTK